MSDTLTVNTLAAFQQTPSARVIDAYLGGGAAVGAGGVYLALEKPWSGDSSEVGTAPLDAWRTLTHALATVQQLDPMYVDVTQSSSDVLKLRRAIAEGKVAGGTAKVKLLFEDGTAYPLPGELQFSDVSVDPNTGAVTLRAVFPNPEGVLLPGLFVRAVLEEATLQQALLVPQQAVTRDATGKPLAYVVGDDGKLQQRELQTERAIGDQWLVTGGLQPGEALVVSGQQKAQPGALVQATAYRAAAAVEPMASRQLPSTKL